MSKPAAIAWDEAVGPAESARRHLPKLAADYFALGRKVMAQEPDPALLHSLRLATKRLRYTLELFRPCYGPGLLRCMAALREVQQLLGEVNDVAAASRALGALMNGDAPHGDSLHPSLRPLFDTRVATFQKYWRELFDSPDQEAWWTYYLARHARGPKRKV